MESYADGCRTLDETCKLMPGKFVAFSFSPVDNNYWLIQDVTKIDASVLTSEEKTNTFNAGLYYVLHTLCPDLESVRRGTTSLVECGGFDWTRKQDARIAQKQFDELVTFYPFAITLLHYHVGTYLGVVGSMIKKSLPEDFRTRFVSGLTFQQCLSDVFLLPDPHASTERMLKGMKESLKRRYDHEKEFSLADESFLLRNG